jgi:hypothetical protein
MSPNKTHLYVFIATVSLIVLIGGGIKFLFDNDYYFFADNKFEVISLIEDPVEQKIAYRNYWGRLITKRAFRKLFGITTKDEGVIRYSVQVGSADGYRVDGTAATAYFIGTQVQPLQDISEIRREVEKNFDDYYALEINDIDVGDRIQIVTNIMASYFPGIGRFNGVFLIVKLGQVYADFDGIHIPMDMNEEELNDIIEQVRPLDLPVRVGVFKENE